MIVFPLCSAPRGPDGRILFDPYERTKEQCLLLGIASIIMLAIQIGIAYKLNRKWLLVGIGAIFVLLHPGWTLRFATDMRSGDCGFLQLIASIGFVALHVAVTAIQLVRALWSRRMDVNHVADYGERSG
jgi:hypothetical protein